MRYGFIPVPKSLPRVVMLPDGGMRYVLLEHLLLEHADQVFGKYDTLEKVVISVTRNADINPTTSLRTGGGFSPAHEKALKKRARLSPVRLELSGRASRDLTEYLCDKLNLKKEHANQARRR